MLKPFQKFTVGLLAVFFLFSTLLGSLVPTAPAQAVIPVTVIEDLPNTATTILDQIWEGLKTAVLGATARVVAYGLRKVAYDSAVWLASGGKGQSAFAHTKDFGSYLSDVGDQAFGQAIEELGKSTGLGNLCKLPDIKLDLSMKVGLRTDFLASTGDPTVKPNCSFQQFSKNWFSGDAWKSQYGGNKITGDFTKALQFDNNDFGIRLDAKEKIGEKITTQSSGAAQQRLEGAGIMPKTGLIAGNIQTPATLLTENFKSITPDKQQTQDNQSLQAMIATGNIRVIPNVLGMFLSTLASTMLKNYQEQGILPFGLGCAPGKANCFGTTGSTNYADQGYVGGRSAAQQYFQSFLETPQLGSDDNYDILGDLNNCDGNGLYNCRADSGLVQAAQESNTGGSVTIADAINRGLLHGDWKLIPPSRVADNADKNFCQHNYCYSNIQVLRQLRIVPLGFEIAALNSNPDHPWTLKQVVDGFDTEQSCNYIRDPRNGTIIGVSYDQVQKPFCRLINPNWVIKLPQVRCANKAYGAIPLTSGVPDRTEECPDVQNCVAYNTDGTCKNFGYCTQEKNIWDFAADTCEPQFATCHSYQDKNGVAQNYLYRTLDTGFCSQSTVGCRAYTFNHSDAAGWLPVAAPGNGNNYSQTGVYFNSNLPSSDVCTAGSAGCSLFSVASSTDSSGQMVQIALKKAPEYMQCYGNVAANGWPQNQSDLTKINAPAACNQYAQACTPDEQSCNWYNPVYGGTRIPGRYTPATVVNNTIQWNDECAAVCVGYNAYQEMPSNYSAGQPVVYITPPNNINNQSSEKVCTAAQAGCSSFTNLGSTQSGLEQVEYYSYLRPCVTPAQNKGAVYVTYEGSTAGGYQLKSYTLVADSGGGPAYFSKDNNELAGLNARCTEALYKAGTADGDCRQFSDSQGAVYYRILSHTIPVSNQCTAYRLNSNEMYVSTGIVNQADCNAHAGFWDVAGGNVCRLCYQNGQYNTAQGACTYMGLPGGVANTAGASNSCTADVNTCRAYKGNAGNNVKFVFTDTFESASSAASLASWNASDPNLSISAESTQVGGHSLGYSGIGRPQRTVQLSFGSSYSIYFWAKGSPQTITVSLADIGSAIVHPLGQVSVGDTWTLYHLGPIDLTGFSTTTATLAFSNPSNGKLFLDNISLKQFDKNSLIYLVKSSLTVDKLCDPDQTDNLPGPALGCTAYSRGSDNANIYVTNFSHLCREGAIGCTAVFDTQNTAQETGPHAYNVLVSGTSGQLVNVKVGTDSYSCQIVPGQNSCYIAEIRNHAAAEIITALGPGAFTPSTVYIPSDTPSNAPMYLVANQAGSCSLADVGCMLAGVETQTPTGVTYTTTTIKNNPDDPSYAGMLCVKEAAGCDAYTDNGSTVYFKDPLVTGQKICDYSKSAVQKVCSNNANRQCAQDADCGAAAFCSSSGQQQGWFWKGVGVCTNNNTIVCKQDGDCGGLGTCANIGSQACYPGYVKNGLENELHSYGDGASYKNFVGECPAEQNLCTEFLDHNESVDASGTPRAYYLIKNAKLSAGDCNGMVNQAAGCALFDETDNPNKFWSTASLYAQSAKINQSVQAVSDPDPTHNDANILLKVNRDRTCSQWLQCRSSHSVYDDKTNKWKQICDVIGRDQVQDSSNVNGTIDGCAHWVDQTVNKYAGVAFSADMYVNRDISWQGREFDGFTLLNLFPVEELTMVNAGISNSAVQGWHLAKTIACGQANNTCAFGPTSNQCAGDFSVCGKSSNGVCVGGLCVENIDGSNGQLTQSPGVICRGYPEKDSPYPNTSKLSPGTNGSTQAAQAYNNAHFCNESAAASDDPTVSNSCECDYTKATYGDVLTKYWNYTRPNTFSPLMVPLTVVSGTPITEAAAADPTGICQGGSRDGRACNEDVDCVRLDSGDRPVFEPSSGQPVIDGTCQKKNKETKYIGWKGTCLEYDLSRNINGDPNQHPCLTWYPVDTVNGTSDLQNQHLEAGYTVTTAAADICLKSNIFKQPKPIMKQPDGVFYNCVDTVESVASGCHETKCKYNGACPAGYTIIYGYCGQGSCNTGIANQGSCAYACVPINSYYYDDSSKQYQSCNELTFQSHDTAVHDNTDKAGTEHIWDLAAKCVTRYAVPSTNLFVNTNLVSNPNPFDVYSQGYGNYYLACEIGAKTNYGALDPNPSVVAWTNHLWPGSGFSINGTNSGALRYSNLTSPVEFGSTYDASTVVNSFPNILLSPWCQLNNGSTISISLPSLTGGFDPTTNAEVFRCANPSEVLAYRTDPNKPPINFSRPYMDLSFTTVPSNPYQGNYKTADKPSDLVSQLFAKLDSPGFNYKFDNGLSANVYSPKGSYVDNNNPAAFVTLRKSQMVNGANLYWDVREHGVAGMGPGSPPTIESLGQCTSVDNCFEGVKGRFTLNGMDVGDVNVSNGNGLVTMKFYAYADADHMPIRQVTVDWGDGSPKVVTPGFYWNQRGYAHGACNVKATVPKCGAWTTPNNVTSCTSDADCSGLDGATTCVAGACSYVNVSTGAAQCTKDSDCPITPICVDESVATDFGHIGSPAARKTCDNHYFTFTHNYSCPAGQTCSFVPMVQIKDNWGWCTGSCGDVNSPGGTGCFDNSTVSPFIVTTDECRFNIGSYIKFGNGTGHVIVSQ